LAKRRVGRCGARGICVCGCEMKLNPFTRCNPPMQDKRRADMVTIFHSRFGELKAVSRDLPDWAYFSLCNTAGLG
jgi:hypothetical protein